MGIQDRDYIRSETRLPWMPSASPWTKFLFCFIACCYLAQLISGSSFHGPDRLTSFAQLNAQRVFEKLEVWRLVTSLFIHDPNMPWSIILNLYFLWVFGQIIEDLEGAKRLFTVYFVIGGMVNLIIAACAYGIPFFVPGQQPDLDRVLLLRSTPLGWNHFYYGASGSLAGMVVWLALKYPYRLHAFAFVFQLTLSAQAAVYLVLDLMTYLDPAHMGFALAIVGHCSATIISFVGVSITQTDGNRWLKSVRQFYSTEVNKSAMTRHRTCDHETTHSDKQSKTNSLELQLDAVLAKLARVGRDQLTQEENDILEKASQSYRQKRK